MAETATLGVFAGMLVAGTAMGIPLAAILAAGLALFLTYGMRRGVRLPELLRAGALSMRSVASMLALLWLPAHLPRHGAPPARLRQS